jgi:hypothetical protein
MAMSTLRPEILDLLDGYLKAKSHYARELHQQLHVCRLQQIRQAITKVLSEVGLTETQRRILGQRLTVLFVDFRSEETF